MHLPPLRPFENCSLVVNAHRPKFTPRQFSASRRVSGESAARGPPGARTPRRKRALGRRAATDATHDAADAGTAGPARPPALGAGRATAWLAGPASARGPRVPRSRRGVGSPHDRRGPCGTSATSGAGRGARRRLAGGACDCSRPVSHPAPKQRGVVSLPSLTYCRGQPCRVRGGAHRPREAPRCNFNPSAVPYQILL